MAPAVLEIEQLTFGYTKEKLLYKDFSLTLHQGELITIVGPSGSGKSTLFELIIGRLTPLDGTLRVGSVSQLFQDPYSSFHPSYTIINQIKDVASTKGIDPLCEAFKLSRDLLEKIPQELSGGQLQRASLIRALLMKPDLLLLDEPTSALDNIVALEVMQLLIKELKSTSMLLITHDESLASWCSDQIIRLS